MTCNVFGGTFNLTSTSMQGWVYDDSTNFCSLILRGVCNPVSHSLGSDLYHIWGANRSVIGIFHAPFIFRLFASFRNQSALKSAEVENRGRIFALEKGWRILLVSFKYRLVHIVCDILLVQGRWASWEIQHILVASFRG